MPPRRAVIVEPPPAALTVREATDVSIAEAEAAGNLGRLDAGPVAAIRALADKIDKDDRVREAYLEAHDGDEHIKPLQLDNVSIPTYLKFCDALGLTPGGRAAQAGKTPPRPPAAGKLGQLRLERAAQSASTIVAM